MKDIDIFKKSRMLKTLSTSAKTYVRDVADILKAVIDPDGKNHPWQHFEYLKADTIPTVCEYSDFTHYLDEWSRLTLEQLRDLFAHDMEMTNLLDVATQRDPGNETGNNQYGMLYNIQETTSKAPTGTSKEAGLRRLRKDAPHIHEMVIAGELSVNKGMIEAGFRKEASPYQLLVRAWGKASEEERNQFMADYG